MNELAEVVSREFRVPAGDWSGSLHLHIGGKTGEVFFATGVIPGVRRTVPKARVVLHMHPHYREIATRSSFPPDEVICDAWYTMYTIPLYEQSRYGLKHAMAFCEKKPWRAVGSELHTQLYRTHGDRKRVNGERRGWYLGFPDAAGTGEFTMPRWRRGVPGPSVAMVFAVGNPHNGGIRAIQMSASDWRAVAEQVKSNGWRPCVSWHKDDPDGRVSLPGPDSGWTFVEFTPAQHLDNLSRCSRVVGLNSGVVWAATQIAPGKVTMVNTQTVYEEYSFSRCQQILDPKRHLEISQKDALSRGMADVPREALS